MLDLSSKFATFYSLTLASSFKVVLLINHHLSDNQFI